MGSCLKPEVVGLVDQQLDLLPPLEHLLDVVHHDVLHLADLRSHGGGVSWTQTLTMHLHLVVRGLKTPSDAGTRGKVASEHV